MELLNACELGNLELVVDLVEIQHVCPSERLDEGICLACKNGHLHVVKYLIEKQDISPSTRFDAPLYWASKYGQLHVVKYLIEDCNISPGINRNEALNYASLNGHMNVIKYLIEECKVNIMCCFDTSLKWAIMNYHDQVVEYILSLLSMEKQIISISVSYSNYSYNRYHKPETFSSIRNIVHNLILHCLRYENLNILILLLTTYDIPVSAGYVIKAIQYKSIQIFFYLYSRIEKTQSMLTQINNELNCILNRSFKEEYDKVMILLVNSNYTNNFNYQLFEPQLMMLTSIYL